MNLELIEQWLWKIAVITLPLGTIWIFRFGRLEGMSWAMGNIGLGFGELLLLGALVASVVRGNIRVRFSVLLIALAWLGELFGRSLAASESMISVLTVIRYGLALLIFATEVLKADLAKWWAIGAIIPCFIGISQALLGGDIRGFSLLGVAPHALAAAGTSVIEVAGERIMRAYGTFPHPNIFGAYLVLTIAVLMRGRERWLRPALAVCAFALALTFSRAAILALLVLLVLEFAESRRRVSLGDRPPWTLLPWITTGLVIGILLFLPAYSVRVGAVPGRLEVQSADARVESLWYGLSLIHTNPLVGVGVMNSVPALVRFKQHESVSSLEPAHSVPLLMLAEWGIIGTLLFVTLMYSARSHLLLATCHLLPILILALFDHALLTSPQLVLLVPIAVQLAHKKYVNA